MKRPFLKVRRPRLLLTSGVGVLAAWVAQAYWSPVSAALVGWNVGVWSYLCLMAWLMARATPVQVRHIARQEDENAVAVLVWMSLAASLSLLAIVYEAGTLASLPGGHARFFFKALLTGATVLGSWALLATIFTFHYAVLYYRSPEASRALRFPDGSSEPDYWDFLYFSFTIAVAAQTSDVSINDRAMRKAVLAHSVLSFLFNAAVIGFSVNIAAGVVGH